MSLKRKVNGEFIEISENTDTFRGDWAPDKLVKQFDLSSEIPQGFVSEFSGLGALAPVIAAAPSGGPPQFTNSVKFQVGSTTNTHSRLTFNTSSLGVPNISKVSMHVIIGNSFGSYGHRLRMAIWKDGVVTARNGSTSGVDSTVAQWKEISTQVGNDDTISFGIDGSSSLELKTTMVGYAVGLKVYAIDRPYMLNDFVTHNGEMWKSLVDNNVGEPGVSGWESSLILPAQSGPTTSRPDSAEVGVGYQYYDTTLKKPIWTDGTQWTDATGTPIQ